MAATDIELPLSPACRKPPPSKSEYESDDSSSLISSIDTMDLTFRPREAFIYTPVPAKDWAGLYPPVLPTPELVFGPDFDEEMMQEIIKETFRKKNQRLNPLYDEIGLVDLPADVKGFLIIDPVSKTRLIDVSLEQILLELGG